MSKHLPYPKEEHTARLACLDPQALAWEWIVRYARGLSHTDDPERRWNLEKYYTPDRLIDAAMKSLEGRTEYIEGGSELEGTFDSTLWEKISILKGIEIPKEEQVSFFSCAC